VQEAKVHGQKYNCSTANASYAPDLLPAPPSNIIKYVKNFNVSEDKK